MAVKRKISSIKCPKCGSKDFGLSELFIGMVDRDFNNGVWDGESAVNQAQPMGRVIAHCGATGCDHKWKIKGISSFNELECDSTIDNPSLEWVYSHVPGRFRLVDGVVRQEFVSPSLQEWVYSEIKPVSKRAKLLGWLKRWFS